MEDMTKEELQKKLEQTKKEKEKLKKDLDKELRNKTRYGLVWEEKEEQFEKDMKKHLPILEEVNDKKIINDNKEDTNLLIEGDNYHSLTNLQYTYKGEIDVIYIDPPYNTGNEFVYNDKKVDKEDSYRHSKWLSFMNKRLKLAKKLLSEDGVIFVSIDDNEQAQLKLLMDKIFGEENFIENFLWNKNPNPTYLNKYSRSDYEYITCYTKKIKSLERLSMVYSEHQKDKSSPFQNKDNPKRKLKVKKGVANFKFEDCKIPKGKYGNTFIENDIEIKNGINENDFYIIGTFRFNQEYLDKKINKGEKVIFKTKKMSPRLTNNSDKNNSFAPLKSISSKKGTTQIGNNEIEKIFGEEIFSYPKPTGLIKHLVNLHPNKNATVLDFFAGSGTTGQAVLELNEEDGGNRNFILCTNNENSNSEKVKLDKVFTFFEERNLVEEYNKKKYKKNGKLRKTYFSYIEEELGLSVKDNGEINLLLQKIKSFINNNETPKENKINKYKLFSYLEEESIVDSYNNRKWYKSDNTKPLKSYKKHVDNLCPFEIENNKVVFNEKELEILKTFHSEEFENYYSEVLEEIKANGICRKVTYPRMEKVMNGYTDNKGNKVEGLGSNLRFFKTKLMPKSFNSSQLELDISQKAKELIKIKEGVYNVQEETQDYTLLKNNEKIVGVYNYYIFDKVDVKDFAEKINGIIENEEFEEVTIYCLGYPYNVNQDTFSEINADLNMEEIPKKMIKTLERSY